MKREANATGTGFVDRMRQLGHNWPHRADKLEREGTVDMLGYSLWHRFGAEYREHMHHFRCTVDTEGQLIGTCSTQDARLFLQAESDHSQIP